MNLGIVGEGEGFVGMFNSSPFTVSAGKHTLVEGLGVTGGRLADRRVAEAEARCAAERVFGVQVEEARLAAVAALTLDVMFALATTCCGIASGLSVEASGDATSARLTALRSKLVKVVVAAVAFVTDNARLALTFALRVALQVSRTGFVTIARDAVIVLSPVVVVTASLAVGAVAIGAAVQAMTSVTRGVEQRLVKEAPGGVVVAVARLAFVGVVDGGSRPRSVVVEGQALVAVATGRVVFAAAD